MPRPESGFVPRLKFRGINDLKAVRDNYSESYARLRLALIAQHLLRQNPQIGEDLDRVRGQTGDHITMALIRDVAGIKGAHLVIGGASHDAQFALFPQLPCIINAITDIVNSNSNQSYVVFNTSRNFSNLLLKAHTHCAKYPNDVFNYNSTTMSAADYLGLSFHPAGILEPLYTPMP